MAKKYKIDELVWDKLVHKKINYNYLKPGMYLKFNKYLDPKFFAPQFSIQYLEMTEVNHNHGVFRAAMTNPGYIEGVSEYGKSWFLLRQI